MEIIPKWRKKPPEKEREAAAFWLVEI